MLVLGRKTDQSVTLLTSDGPVLININNVNGCFVSLGFEAPQSVKIVRTELLEAKQPMIDARG